MQIYVQHTPISPFLAQGCDQEILQRESWKSRKDKKRAKKKKRKISAEMQKK